MSPMIFTFQAEYVLPILTPFKGQSPTVSR